MALTGPSLDVAVRRASGGWRLYLAIMFAGLLSNLIDFGVKAGEKLMLGGGRSWGSWFVQAAGTYPLCGVIAGLISAVVWFHLRSVRRGDTTNHGG
jgi:ABC-type Co2+ transport system permease subunit